MRRTTNIKYSAYKVVIGRKHLVKTHLVKFKDRVRVKDSCFQFLTQKDVCVLQLQSQNNQHFRLSVTK